jgi:hypothetical protein
MFPWFRLNLPLAIFSSPPEDPYVLHQIITQSQWKFEHACATDLKQDLLKFIRRIVK